MSKLTIDSSHPADLGQASPGNASPDQPPRTPAAKPAPPPQATSGRPGGFGGRGTRLFLWSMGLVLLGSIFLAYLSPHLARDLATRVWACF
jgi:hypothetical protein